MSSSGESLLSARLPLALVDEREAYWKATVTRRRSAWKPRV